MIRRREATRISLQCDACTKGAIVYTSHLGDDFDLPEGWESYPEYIVSGGDPRAILCPDHAHLTSTLRLMDSLAARVAGALA